ncbi:platelet-activating factor acetylhydrolase IB subunit beta homolog [Agrilus planipennis]|uniref:Platelet-activating factor acetylhydrolase IB subunit beta homolog n=1 Tax=Agrilus planipennis TaxID=224129 RepID=A0A1W4XJ40_AGRPL|nr:platelet-activating factor acetylhydrolase IB subunit beta homolog [Agrilus planipennis]
MNSCLIPQPKKDNCWQNKHIEYEKKSKSCDADVVWIGDSIIERIQTSSLWKEKISKFKCVNYGIGGDRVENVLWRVENGELDFNCKIKVVVLHLGTNNISQSVEEISEGIVNLVEIITKKLDDVTILFPTLLPKGQFPNRGRETNQKVNELLTEIFSDSKYNGKVIIIPIHKNIIENNGTISRKMLHDYLHLTDDAYNKVFLPVYAQLELILGT